MGLLGFEDYDDLKNAHYKWVEGEIESNNCDKEDRWTQSIAVGSKPFIEKIKKGLGFRAKGRKIISADDTFELRDIISTYDKTTEPDFGNTFLWNLER